MQAWRLSSGRYTLLFGESRSRMMVGPAGGPLEPWVVTEEQADLFGAEKVFGVITGPSSCGCEPAMFRWVGEREVEAGRTTEKPCESCAYRDPTSAHVRFVKARHQCDIIDVCGEADVAMAVYEAEFAAKIGSLS